MSPEGDRASTAVDVVVVGGGQAGLAAGYYLRRAGHDFVILDAEAAPGGSWPHYWESLRLFSPAEHSSLPGIPMPVWRRGFPPAGHVVDYLTAYEQRYRLPIHRPVRVTAVSRTGDGRYLVESDRGTWRAGAVVNATGTWRCPFWPRYRGMSRFAGTQVHTVGYRTPEAFAGQRVAVVGGGNSAAQILAEVFTVADTLGATPHPPRLMPDDVDGRVLFDVASARAQALASGRADTDGVAGLGDIVMVPPVKAARDRGVLVPQPMFSSIAADGLVYPDRHEQVDAIIWCTGFRPVLNHLRPLALRRPDRSRPGRAAASGRIPLHHNHVPAEPGLLFLGYGDWTGPASATLIGVGRTARDAVAALGPHLAATAEARTHTENRRK
ncbi:putative FAD-dependent oxidoreductase [Gordonia hirsuta DSM 44140 = NBRC 16056]|uniref:Putative FAD-dependent oxidoreductase n=1 Tax=Gordonia hirsuta DSM 44140 = NBRC 16056 TaxID=1121927 RepID=L7L5A4_9ACTN|nr:ArsO family NAD(P)H-dependent flavin-containing monooxygenase [Gordonia hirsuta]GAC56320.1 putative FAD-dependent oxidoreductase [Gordonia hirsuta DSM 44140 = NBRC 16056]